jgi:glycosyltransferase involved in cell wall biosynthesis
MISVCIPTYNGEKHIHRQISSILAQLSDDDEIIISDDSSSDSTLEIIRSFNDKRITVLENNTFRSPIFNAENALKYAKGSCIFLADQDDIWEENKVKISLKYLQEYDLVLSDCRIVDENENEIADSFFRINHSKKGFLNNLIRNSYVGCCMAFRKELLDYCLPFPENISMHDVWLGLNADLTGKVAFIDDKLIRYRRHGGNFSVSGEKSPFGLKYRISYRIQLLSEIIRRRLERSRTKS